VALAFARTGLLSTLRRGLPWFDRVSATLVIATGLYLTWYWYGAITDRGSDNIISRVERMQTKVVEFLQEVGAYWLAAVFIVVIGIAVIVIRRPTRVR
jgi:glucan phosphoethanolaminetransferase (alkaline phosphatase superfamily)